MANNLTPPDHTNESDDKANSQGIFDARFTAVMDAFGAACEQQGIVNAIAIAKHPDEPIPLVFIMGHQFDSTSMAARVIRQLQDNLMQQLSGS